MSDYFLKYTGPKIDELLEAVDQKTIYADATRTVHGLMSAEDKEKLDSIDEAIGRMLQFKGFVSQTAPTGTIKGGSLWYVADSMPVSFPVNVKTYDATTGVWSATTSVYNPEALDLWSNMNDDKEYYWFGNSWNMIDDNGRFTYVSTFTGVVGNPSVLYYLDTAYSTYEKGFYRFVPASGGNPEKFVLLNKELFKYVSTFTGEAGDTDRLYYLDTAYGAYKKGFYRYNGTAFVNINPKDFFIVSTFTGVVGDNEALYYLDTAYDDYKIGFYRFIPASGSIPDKFVRLDKALVQYVSTFVGVTGDAEMLYYLDTAYDDYKEGFYRFIPAAGTTPEKFELIGSDAEVFTDVDVLPQENILDNTIYRLKVFKYFYEGKEIAQPVGYKSVNTICSISSDYIAIAGGDTYEWKDVDDTVRDYLISQNYLVEVSNFEDAEMFRLGYNKYVYFPLVEKVPRYELYHNPEKNPAQYLLIDDERVKKFTTSGLHAYIHDGITQDEMPIVTEIGDNDPTSQEVHALDTNLATELAVRKAIDENVAIIDVDHLPSDDINIHSLYRVSNDYFKDGEDIYDAVQAYEIISDSVTASASGLVWDGTYYAWENVTDSIIAELVTISAIRETTSVSDSKIIKLDAHLYDYSGNVTIVKAGLYHNIEKGVADWILVGGGTDVNLDDITTETVNNKVQANAVIHVSALPTTNIKEKSLYEITETVSWEEHHYTHNADPVVEIKSYKLTPTGGQVLEITENNGIWFAHTQTWTPWNELTESTIDYYILINRLMECDFDDADKQFSGYKENAESAWKYDYKTKVTDTPTTESFTMTKLFRRRDNQWESISTIELTSEQYARLTNAQKNDGTIYILDTDYVEAIIDVTELPTTDIETQSLYRINEHVHKEEWNYYHNDTKLNEPPILYRSTSPNFVVSETKVTVNGVDYQYTELNPTLIESWLGTYIETVPEFNNAQFCCYDVEYYDYAGNFIFEHPIVDFNMLKLFSRYNDTWKSHSTIKLTQEQYDALTATQKNDTTVYIVGSDAAVDEVTTELVNGKIQANAVISVDALPTTNIKENSFYELTENIQYGDYSYSYSPDGSSIILLDSAPTCYKVTEAGVEYGMVVTADYIEEPSQIGPATQYYFRTGHTFQVNEVYVEIWLENGYISKVEWDEREFCGYNNGTEFDYGDYFSREGSSQSFSMTKFFKRRNDAWRSVSTIKVTEEVYNLLTEDQKNDGTVYIVGENAAIIDVSALPTTNIASNVLYRLHIDECRRKPTGDVIENAVAYRSKNLEDCSYNTDGMSFRQPGEEPMFYPWDNVDDTIIFDLLSGGYIEETSLEQGDFFKAAPSVYLYKTSVELVSYYELYHNPTATAGEFIKIGGGDVDIDNQTIVKVSEQLRANAIIDIETLPTTNILKNSIYRKYGESYMYKGAEIAEPNGYVSADTERVVITSTGIDHLEEGTLLNHYNWEDVTDSVIFTVGNLSPVAFDEADMFKVGDNQYDYKTTVTKEQICELYHNPTGLQNGYKLIGGGGSAEVDEITTEIVNDKVQANAIIPVASLPTTDIKEKSLYQYTENVGYVLDHWTRHGEEISTPLHFYKSISTYLQVYNGEILYNNEAAGDTDWPYPNNHVEWSMFTDEHLTYFLNKNLVVECTPNDGTFCEYEAGKYDWKNDGSYGPSIGVCYSSETKSFSMTKLFRRVNGAWESISVIGLTGEQYNALPASIRSDGTMYIVDDAAELVIEKTYKALADKPVVNGVILNGSLTLEDLGLYSRTEVNALLENKGQVEFVDALPVTPTKNTWYYSKKFEDGTDVPDDKRCLYIVDEDTTVFHEMGIVGDIEMETGDTLSGSEHIVTSSQVVKKELSTKIAKYGTQVNIETAVDDATLWANLAQIGTDDKKTDSSMVFNAGTCYLIHTVSPTKTAQIFQFIVTGSVGASAINKKITLINPTTNEVFTKAMDGGTWQPWKGGKKYKHTLVRYNNDSFEYPMGWVSIISNKKTMTYNDFRDWLNTNGYTTGTNSYYWCGGCCGTTGVRNSADTGTAYVGRVASGVFYDGTNMFFKYDYNGTVTILASRCKIITEELN